MDSAKWASYNAISVTFKFYPADSKLDGDSDLNAFCTTSPKRVKLITFKEAKCLNAYIFGNNSL